MPYTITGKEVSNAYFLLISIRPDCRDMRCRSENSCSGRRARQEPGNNTRGVESRCHLAQGLPEIRTAEAGAELSRTLNDVAKTGFEHGVHPVPLEVRQVRAQVLLCGIATVNRNIDLKFDKDDLPAENLAPEGPYMSGISPAAIKDPQIRQKYETALRENSEKGNRHSLQLRLREMQERFPTRSIYLFLHINYDEAKPEDRQELAKLLKEEIKDGKLREELWH
jgi:hypothetical protein